jgi:PTS system nitrogen regulatory IIA component
MQISKFIPKTCILPDMKVTTKSETLTQLVNLLCEKKKIPDSGMALDQIFTREATESTGIGNGIAVPHARVPGMKGLACALGRVPKGMDFTALDKRPVHLIFLICYPPQDQTTYLNFVATVAKLLSDKAHAEQLLKADGVDEIVESLAHAESHDVVQAEYDRKLKTTPDGNAIPDAHAGLVLLARLQLYQEMLAAAKSGKTDIKQRIEQVRSLVEPKVLAHYDRLAKGRAPALVSVEGDTCQGCFMRLPSKFVQKVREDRQHIYSCPNCSRYIYVV